MSLVARAARPCSARARQARPARCLALARPPVAVRVAPCARAAGAPRGLANAAARVRTRGAEGEPVGLVPTDLLDVYRGLVASGQLRWDDEQVRVVMKLRHLLAALADYAPPRDLLARLPAHAPAAARQWFARARLGLEHGERERGLVRVLSGAEEVAALTTPKGILLTGPPGTGKSLLLSLFFSLLRAPKRRAHYHAFSLALYRAVFVEAERRRLAAGDDVREARMDGAAREGWRGVVGGAGDESIAFVVARDMIMQYHVLYFDELQLVDAASAAILRDVLTWFWRLGGVVVSCTNRVPEDLYHHGVQRERMLGFLDSLRARCDVVQLDGGRDWRVDADAHGEADAGAAAAAAAGADGTASSGAAGTGEASSAAAPPAFEGAARWSALSDAAFDAAWEAAGGSAAPPRGLRVYGRTLLVPSATAHACRYTFGELCESPLGPADYLALASTYAAVFIDAVPPLLLRNKNEARRLINLVDALYESRCQLFIRSSTTLDHLFFPDAAAEAAGPTALALPPDDPLFSESLSETLQPPSLPNVSLYDARTRAQRLAEEARAGAAGAHGRARAAAELGIYTGEDERFAYRRAQSRLAEMQSRRWAHKQWVPLEAAAQVWGDGAALGEAGEVGEAGGTAVGAAAGAGVGGTAAPWVERGTGAHRDDGDDGDALAVEAGYARTYFRPRAGPAEAAEAAESAEDAGADAGQLGGVAGRPRIGAQHAWGVADWGERAGRWGRGPRAYGGEQEGEGRGGGGAV